LLTLTLPVIACALAPAYLPTPQTISASDAWTHGASGMTFPATVAGFERNEIAHFSANTPDIAVNYRLIAPTGWIDATVYLMPEPLLPTLGLSTDAAAAEQAQACRDEFAAREHEITLVNQAQSKGSETVALEAGGERRTGRLARFSYQADFAGHPQQIQSQLARFCAVGRGWSIEYRFSYPAGFPASGWIAAFVAELKWQGALASAALTPLFNSSDINLCLPTRFVAWHNAAFT
jgi:hypothetical protein